MSSGPQPDSTMPSFGHVGAAGDLETLEDVLLDQHDRGAGAVDLDPHAKGVEHDEGRDTHRRLWRAVVVA
jgi:hypothetical protein